MLQNACPTVEEVNDQLQEILASKDFQASPRLRNFLKYIVGQTLAGRGDLLKAYAIGVDVLNLGESFDPNNNPMVRTEASRLRNKLEHYYLRNPQARVHISMPKGSYCASFSKPAPEAQNSGAAPAFKNKASSFYKASIMLLPFLNVNSTPEATALATGINSSISINLTKFSNLKVINYAQLQLMDSVLGPVASKNTPIDARFLLCGSIQVNQGVVEVHTSLVDSIYKHNIWAEKFDAELDCASLFEVQEHITQCIVERIADDFGLLQRTLLQELARGSSEISKFQEASLLYYHWTTVLAKNDFVKALESVEEACNAEPGNVYMRAMLADLCACDQQFSYGLIEKPLIKSFQLASSAVNQDPACQIGYMALALTYCLLNDEDKFKFFAQRAIELNPASTNAIISIGTWYATLGMWDEALDLVNRIIDKTPSSPGWCHFVMALYKYCHNHFEDALSESLKINMPENIWDCMVPLAAGGVLGEKKECENALAKMLLIYPEFNEKFKQIIQNNLPCGLVSAKVLDGIQKALNLLR